MAKNATIPNRQVLIDRLTRSNRYAYPILFAQIGLCFFIASLIDWQRIANEPLITTVVAVGVLAPWAMSLARSIAQKKVEINKLKEETRFGEFDKHILRRLYSETLRKLSLPDDHLPLYITADKSLNAMSAHNGLGALFKRFNGLYLHRQVLHMLTPQEVQDTIGHELGHYYAYYYRLDRFQWVPLVLATLMATAVAQYFNFSFLLYALVPLCSVVAFFISNMVGSQHTHAIEYLCDDFGAHTNGVEVSINALMKLGANAEAQMSIFFETWLAERNNNHSAQEVLEAVMRAIPYGHSSQEESLKAVERELAHRKKSGASVAGFLDYAWNAGDEESADEQMDTLAKQYKALLAVPRLKWEQLLDNPHNIDFHGESLHDLIEMIEEFPQYALFREVADPKLARTHPLNSDRILYLWYNREAIEKSPVNPNRY